jgi:nucleoside-diphosphate-sugar epimerase
MVEKDRAQGPNVSFGPRPLVLVTGATGSVGPRVVQELDDAGLNIRTLSIDPIQPGILPDQVEVLTGDVTDSTAVESAMDGVEAVIHLASPLHITNPPPTLCEKYEKINVGGTANVVNAAVEVGVKRLVFFSTIAVYGNSNGQILTEDTTVQPNTFYAETKLAAERIVLDARRKDGCPLGTVLRFAAIYGPRIKGNYQRLVQALARRRFVPVGDGSNRRTLIYDRDGARASLLAVQHPNAAGKVYNVSDGQFPTLKEIIVAIYQALGRTPPRFSVPVGPARFMAGLMEDTFRFVGRKFPIGRETIDKYTEDIAVDSQRIQNELGFKPQYDLQLGWQETIQEMWKMAFL